MPDWIQKLWGAAKWVYIKLPHHIARWGLAVIVALVIALMWKIVFGHSTLMVGNQSFAVLGDRELESRAVPVGGIVMWWGNWEAAKKDNSLTNYELCDGAKVDTDGPLKDKVKPNFMKAFPRGLGPGLTNGQEQAHYVPGKETISLLHHHTIAGRALVSSSCSGQFPVLSTRKSNSCNGRGL